MPGHPRGRPHLRPAANGHKVGGASRGPKGHIVRPNTYSCPRGGSSCIDAVAPLAAASYHPWAGTIFDHHLPLPPGGPGRQAPPGRGRLHPRSLICARWPCPQKRRRTTDVWSATWTIPKGRCGGVAARGIDVLRQRYVEALT